MAYSEIHILPHFQFKGNYKSCREVHSGNINNTYILEFSDGDSIRWYTMQRVNTNVFRNPRGLMGNIDAVTRHLRENILKEHGNPDRQVLELVRANDGDCMYTDGDGGVWRAYTYITNALALDVVTKPEQMEEVGRGFGRFQRYLADFPAEQLCETIPGFHNTIKRFEAFQKSVAEDKAGRVHGVRAEIDFMLERGDMMGEIVRQLESGALPLRVTHNDAKSNNVLLDEASGKALCVIDLDTVMPGSSLYDYGDGVRFGASAAREDERDTSRVFLDMEKARAFTRGFVQETAGILSSEELLCLPLGAKVITCEMAMRFLHDYLDGDIYFKINAPDHNLVRARAQIALQKSIEKKEPELNAMVESYISGFSDS